MFLFCVFLSGVCLNYTTIPETKKTLLWQPQRNDICLIGRSFVSSGGLRYVRSHLNGDSHQSPVPRALLPPPKAGQLLPGPENANFDLESKATRDAAWRTAAEPRPLQANDPLGGPDPTLLERGCGSHFVPSALVSNPYGMSKALESFNCDSRPELIPKESA